jgi:hypothetical protein
MERSLSMNIVKHSIVAAGLIGGAVMLSSTGPAAAATLAPALAPATDTAAVNQVTHDPLARPGRTYVQRSWQPRRTYPRYGYSPRYRHYGPTVGFGLSVPGFSFGIGVPPRHHYGYGRPYHGYPYSYGFRGY